MNHLLLVSILLLAPVFLCGLSGTDDEPVRPSGQDEEILATLLSHLLDDPDEILKQRPWVGEMIVVHERTPKIGGYFLASHLHKAADNRHLPVDAIESLQERNAVPESNASVHAVFTNLQVEKRVVVADLSEVWNERRRSSQRFTDEFPTARVWMVPYLPGYSKDGMTTLVRASVGPWPHPAMLTAVLQKDNDMWKVEWYHITFYL